MLGKAACEIDYTQTMLNPRSDLSMSVLEQIEEFGWYNPGWLEYKLKYVYSLREDETPSTANKG